MHLVCAIYEHAAQVIGETPWRVSRDAGLLARAHAGTYQRYHHAPVVVGIDVYHLEAEAYGAAVHDAGGVGTPKLSPLSGYELDDLLTLPALDTARAGRLPMVLQAGRQVRDAHPEADVRIPVTGLFTLAAQLIGLEPLLMELLTEPDAVSAALQHLLAGQRRWCRQIADAGLGMVVFESAASPPMMSPMFCRQVLFPPLGALLAEVQAVTGAGAMLIQGGDTAALTAELCALPIGHLLCPAETDQAAFMAGISPCPTTEVRVNMRAGVIASPHWPDIQQELDRTLALAHRHPAGCIGTGIIPYDTPSENILRAISYVTEV